MRLGGYVKAPYEGPREWARHARRLGYRAAPFPVDHRAGEQVAEAYRSAAEEAGIVIAEVGAWGNPISPDGETRKEAIRFAQRQLELADRIGARVCVNITGTLAEQWDGPHPGNFSDDAFALIVDSVREIIDAVKPERTCYALETMPWALPDSADAYLGLIAAIDRPQLAVHFDPVNMISSPRTFYRNADLIRDFVSKLGPYIRNAHAKDIALGGKLTVHLSETLPGTGRLDYAVFLTELNKLDPELTLVIEHLNTEEEYAQAYAHIKGIADRLNVPV